MAISANEVLRDATISHQVDLQHYSNGVVRRIIALLNKTDSDLVAQLVVVLDKLDRAGSLTADRLQAMLASVRYLNVEAYNALRIRLPTELSTFAHYEAGFQLQLFEHTVQVHNLVESVNAEQVYAAAMSRPFQGRLLSEWAADQADQRMVRIRDAIRMGVVENQTNGQIVTRIRGTRAAGYSDGILEIDRRNAEAVVRTSVQHVAAFVRERFIDANADIIDKVVWVSTLDARTTPQCRIRDGLQYTTGTHRPLGHSVPWGAGPGELHWNCRSTSVPVVKSFRDLGIPIDELPPGSRASMDGQVPADTTYGQWLQKQSAARQDQILGATRGKLLRDGGVAPDQFYNNKGVYLTLDELRTRDAAAFVHAGL